MFTDIHGNLEALKAIIEDIEKKQCDEIICLGDVLSIGPNPKECLDLIMNKKIKMVLGNHEMYCLNDLDTYRNVSEGERKHIEWVKSCLEEKHYEYLKKLDIIYSFGNIVFMHFPYDEKEKDFLNPNLIYSDDKINIFNNYKGFDYYIFGHEHRRNDYEYDGRYYYCLGSSGCNKTGKTHYTIIDINRFVSVYKKEVDYDRYTFEQKLNNMEYPEKKFLAYNFFGYTI